MKNIIHISDLHFGRDNKKIARILLDTINNLTADLVVISGDFTQRARTSQFKAAQDFLQEIKIKTLVVPGNHDIPLFNIFARFNHPYQNYQKYITPILNPSYSDSDTLILGINSITPYQAKNGVINQNQLDLIKNFFKGNDDKIKIAVMHHNLIELDNYHHPIVNYKTTITQLLAAKVNIVLSGHLHLPYVEEIPTNTSNNSQNLFLITAGTAISTRLRNADNSFNYIQLNKTGFTLEVYRFLNKKFIVNEKNEFLFSSKP